MGADLLKKLSENTGLPEHLVTYELEELLRKAGIKAENATLEDVRDILADYLQDVLLDAKREFK